MAYKAKKQKYILADATLARMRKMFNLRITRIFLSRENLYEWRQNDWVQNTINVIEAYNQDSTKAWTEEEIDLTTLYEVEERDGKKILRIKAEVNGKKLLQIIALEDYFDVLHDAHMKTNHAARCKMREYLKHLNIYMPFAALIGFLKLCKVCQSRNLAPKKRCVVATREEDVNHGYVELLDMSSTPDGEYKYVMYYKDMTTECTFLRPLRTPRVVEVAEELLKLFLQIGCPGVLHTPTTSEFTEAIIQKLKIDMPHCLILNGRKMKSTKKLDKIELRKWMVENSSAKWSHGIFMVAHKLNLRKIGSGKSTPFKNLLGMNPKDGFNTRGMLAVLKNVMHEEELEKIVQNLDEEFSEDSDEENEKKIGEMLKKREEKIKNTRTIMDRRLKHYIAKCDNNVVKMCEAETLPGPNEDPKPMDSPELKLDSNQIASLNKTTESEGLHVKHIPVKTYKRKSKTEVASVSKTDESDKIETFELKPKKLKLNVSKAKPKGKKGAIDTKTQIEIESANKVNQEKKVLCIDNNIKVRCYVRNDSRIMCKKLKERNQSWNTPEIDLPAVPAKSINLDLDQLKTVAGFGEIPKECKDLFKTPMALNESAGICDSFNTECVVPVAIKNELEEGTNFGVIVKIESV